MRVVTWNVLHRVHAVNYDEAPVRTFPDERVRIAAITERIAGWLAAGADVVCLQEVSGDQLASLRGIGARVFDHLYPRVPKLRDGSPSPLADSSEHLVVLTNAPDATLRQEGTFKSDPGKGFLAVDLGGVTIVDTHVSFGAKRVAQLAIIVDVLARGAVLGDFNATADLVAAALGPAFTMSSLCEPTHEHTTIDHVVLRGGTCESVSVEPSGGLSDHATVLAELRF